MASDGQADLAKLVGAHLVALSKATSVYQAELAKLFLGLEDQEDREEAGPAYKMMRDLEKVGLASAMLDRSPDAGERRLRSVAGSNAVLLENWFDFVALPWRRYWESVTSPAKGDDV